MRPKLRSSGLVLWLAIAACEVDESVGPSQTAGKGGAGGQSGAGASGGSHGGSMGNGASAGVSGTTSSGGSGASGASAGSGAGGAGGNGGGGGSVGQGGTGGGAGAIGSSGAGGLDGSSGSNGTGGAGGSGGSADGGGSKFHVFLLLGQSNMAGYPKAQAADKVENPRIRVLGFDNCQATGRQQDKWDVAAPPLHECWNGAIGPGDYFSRTLLDRIPSGDTIGLVPCAISGERIETFLKSGGSKYGWILERAKLAQQAGGVIEGMIFHQGESNNGDPNWPANVNRLVTDLRTDLALGNVPFLAGELPYDSPLARHNTQVNRVPTVVTNAYVVSASGLALDAADTSRLHFGHDAQVTFGQRYAAKMIEALRW